MTRFSWMGWRRPTAMVALVLVIAAGCSDESKVTTTATAVAPSTTTSTAATTVTVSGVWDVVALGDSFVAGTGAGGPQQGFTGVYARKLAEQLGIETRLHAFSEGYKVAEWNQVLAENRSMQDALIDAEIVIIWLGYHNVLDVLWGETCDPEWPEPLRTCLIEATATMPADFDDLLGTIEALVPEGAIVMIGNQALGPPEIERWGGEPYWPELKAVAHDGWAEGIADAAAAHGAILVDSALWLTGPEGNELLRSEFLSSDNIHFTHIGYDALAELFLAADGLE